MITITKQQLIDMEPCDLDDRLAMFGEHKSMNVKQVIIPLRHVAPKGTATIDCGKGVGWHLSRFATAFTAARFHLLAQVRL